MRNWIFRLSLCAAALGAYHAAAFAAPLAPPPMKVVTTTEDLAAIVREVGGDLVDVEVFSLWLPGPRTSCRALS